MCVPKSTCVSPWCVSGHPPACPPTLPGDSFPSMASFLRALPAHKGLRNTDAPHLQHRPLPFLLYTFPLLQPSVVKCTSIRTGVTPSLVPGPLNPDSLWDLEDFITVHCKELPLCTLCPTALLTPQRRDSPPTPGRFLCTNRALFVKTDFWFPEGGTVLLLPPLPLGNPPFCRVCALSPSTWRHPGQKRASWRRKMGENTPLEV